MIWMARIMVVGGKTIAEARRGRVTPSMVHEITWWLMFGQSHEDWDRADA